MTQPNTPEPDESGAAEPSPGIPTGPVAKPSFRQRYVRLPRRRRSRWLLAGAAAVVVLAAVGTAGFAAGHHGDRRAVRAFGFEGGRGPFAGQGDFGPGRFGPGQAGPESKGRQFKGGGPGWTGPDGAPGAPGAPGDGAVPGGKVFGGRALGGKAAGGKLAPAPLPAVAADQALAKALAAVPNGKVEALSVVGREGGGSSWAVVVLGSDGVRHLVTVDGVDGSVTGNTVDNGR